MAKIRHIQPEGLVEVKRLGFSQVVTSQGGTHVHIAGQTPVDKAGNPVGIGDIEAQTHQVMQNLKEALSAVSATFDDVVKLTVLIVDYEPSVRGVVLGVTSQYISADRAPAATLIGVQSLISEAFLVEIDAVAVID